MTFPRDLSPVECADLIGEGGVGRLAFCTPMGPQIYPLNFTVDGRSIVFRTAPYSRLGTLQWGIDVVFEVDQLNWSTRTGWSVVVKGAAKIVDDADEIERLHALGLEPKPWAKGMRRMYVRVPWREITGRAVGEEWLGSSPPAYLKSGLESGF